MFCRLGTSIAPPPLHLVFFVCVDIELLPLRTRASTNSTSTLINETNVPRDRDPPFFLSPSSRPYYLFTGCPRAYPPAAKFQFRPTSLQTDDVIVFFYYDDSLVCLLSPTSPLRVPDSPRQLHNVNGISSRRLGRAHSNTIRTGQATPPRNTSLSCLASFGWRVGPCFSLTNCWTAKKKKPRESFPRQSRGTCRSGPIFYFFYFFWRPAVVPTKSSTIPLASNSHESHGL